MIIGGGVAVTAREKAVVGQFQFGGSLAEELLDNSRSYVCLLYAGGPVLTKPSKPSDHLAI